MVPLYKKGDKNSEGNYRPVSILPVISKIFEKVVYNQTNEYLQAKNILYHNQSGFREGYSTDTALIGLSEYINTNMDEGKYTGLILLDLQKAFDTVNHGILLSSIGMNTNATEWFNSYLSGRTQFVDLGGVHSKPNTISCGVPQGSILGPLLFLIM